ncbi:MAG TPA: hypothetical protein VMM13_12125 [Euzebya sp.]|nr:hypothetical protein [Euzebya sp.]
MSEDTGSRSDRREFLRRSAVVGAHAAWTIPAVQVMARAQAQTPSQPIAGFQFPLIDIASGTSPGVVYTSESPLTTSASPGCDPPDWSNAYPPAAGVEVRAYREEAGASTNAWWHFSLVAPPGVLFRAYAVSGAAGTGCLLSGVVNATSFSFGPIKRATAGRVRITIS